MTTLSTRRGITAWTFLAPMLVVLALVAGWPLIRTILLSFTDAGLGDFADSNWIGFGNYSDLIHDANWWRAVANTVAYTVISVTIETILGLIIALTLDARLPGRGVVRAAVLIPWAIPTVVSAKMWGWMLNDQFGIINDLFMRLHLIDHKIAWAATADTAMYAVLAVDVWKTTPFMALLILAGLQMVPKDI